MAAPVRTVERTGERRSPLGKRSLRRRLGTQSDRGRRASASPPARRARLTPSLWIGGGIVALFLLAALAAPLLAPHPPDLVAGESRLLPPGLEHLFGTDPLGRDLFSRVLYGARIAVRIALLGVAVAGGLGVSLGLAAGFYGGWRDQILSRTMEIWLAFPSLLLALVIVARLGPGLDNAVIALGIVGAPTFFRLTRTATLSARGASYVDAARAVGASDRRILLRHILPNIAPSLVVLATMRLGVLILAGGGLSFIGLGAQPPQPEWGALLATGRDYMDVAPWLALFPGLCITLVVAGLNLLGDGLRDLLDPRRR
jgi:peptide/nickel transport system permease protein